MSGCSPPSWTIKTLFSATFPVLAISQVGTFPAQTRTVHGEVAQRSTSGPLYFNVGVLEKEQNRAKGITIDGPDIWGNQVSRPVAGLDSASNSLGGRTAHTPRSVISANVKLALR